MQRRHYLPRNKGTETPANLLFFDTECFEHPHPTDKDKRFLSLRLWVAIAGRLEKGKLTRRHVARGHTAQEFWEFFCRHIDHDRPLWAFAHNEAFDMTQLDFWREHECQRFTVGPVPRPPCKRTGKPRKPWTGKLCLESSPFFAVVRHPKGIVKFIDTYNYWPSKAEQMGKPYGIEKLPWPGFDADDETLFAYCLRDVEIVEAAIVGLMSWWRAQNCGTFKMTAAALALANYQHTAQARTPDGEKVNLVCEPGAAHHALERASHFGGRFEAFRLGEIDGRVHKVDCNSMYLAMMEDNQFPRRSVGPLIDPTPDKLLKAMCAYGAVAHVWIKATGNAYPKRHEGRQLHVTGNFDTVLCGPELRRALEAGDVARVIDAQLYSICYLFRGWALQWHVRKMAARGKGPDFAGEAEFAKLVGLSLSGKWAQHSFGWKDRPDMGREGEYRRWTTRYPGDEKFRVFRGIPPLIQEQCEGEAPGHSFPAISAYICSYAREHMRRVIECAPERSVYYLGTDGLLCNDSCLSWLQNGDMLDEERLGAFKHEGGSLGACVMGPNLYRFNGEWIRAGTHGRPKRRLDGSLYSESFEGIAETLTQRPDGRILVRVSEFTESVPVAKRKLIGDGWTEPLWIMDDNFMGDRPSLRLPPEPRLPRPPRAEV